MRYVKNTAEFLDIQWDRIDGSFLAEPEIQLCLPQPDDRDQEKIMGGLKTLAIIYSNMHACADSREEEGQYFFEKIGLPQACSEQAMVYSQAYRLARRLRAVAAAISDASDQYWDTKVRSPRELAAELERMNLSPDHARTVYKRAYVKVEEAEKDLLAFDSRMTRLFADHRKWYCMTHGIRDPLIKSILDDEERPIC